MTEAGEFKAWTETEKHRQGQHNQKTHGNRMAKYPQPAPPGYKPPKAKRAKPADETDGKTPPKTEKPVKVAKPKKAKPAEGEVKPIVEKPIKAPKTPKAPKVKKAKDDLLEVEGKGKLAPSRGSAKAETVKLPNGRRVQRDTYRTDVPGKVKYSYDGGRTRHPDNALALVWAVAKKLAWNAAKVAIAIGVTVAVAGVAIAALQATLPVAAAVATEAPGVVIP